MLLYDFLPELKAIGIDGINISLDTLNTDTFQYLTRRTGLPKVLASIIACQESGIRTKINSVLLQKINNEDFFQLVELAKKYPVDVRFIELMPIGYGKQYRGRNRQELMGILSEQYPDHIPVSDRRGNGPATYIRLPGFSGCIGFIDAIHGKFCNSCNRVRLTSDGLLKLCLYYQNGINLKEMLRRGDSDEKIRVAINEAILQKPAEHQFHSTALECSAEQRRMAQIGG